MAGRIARIKQRNEKQVWGLHISNNKMEWSKAELCYHCAFKVCVDACKGMHVCVCGSVKERKGKVLKAMQRRS